MKYKQLPKWSERGKRLRIFYDRYGYKSQRIFAERMGIREQHVKLYFDGFYDPLNLAEGLKKDGCNIDWLVSGKLPEDDFFTITDIDRSILAKLKSYGIDTIEKVEYFCNPENLAHDLSTAVVREVLAKYKAKLTKKRKPK